MRKPATLQAMILATMAFMATQSRADNGLTDLENRWINAAVPVLDYAESQGLPIDIIVQPETPKGAVPLAMGFDSGRCKLVLTLRGNADAEASLKGLNDEQQALAIEAMAAHEIAHCWRRASGDWNTVPHGFVTSETSSARQQMEQTRREEGFADVFGLAWMQQKHPEKYGEMHAWFTQVRAEPSVPGGHHDTRNWVELTQDASIFDADKSLFEQAQMLWERGLN